MDYELIKLGPIVIGVSKQQAAEAVGREGRLDLLYSLLKQAWCVLEEYKDEANRTKRSRWEREGCGTEPSSGIQREVLATSEGWRASDVLSRYSDKTVREGEGRTIFDAIGRELPPMPDRTVPTFGFTLRSGRSEPVDDKPYRAKESGDRARLRLPGYGFGRRREG